MRALPVRVDAVLIQAVIAAALSFAHLHDIANAAGQHGWKAWAYPVSVDLLLVAAWQRLRSGSAGRVAGWSWFVIALAASLGANIATAGLLDLDDVPAWLRVLVAGWPAVAFLGGTLLGHSRQPAEESEPARVERGDVDQEHAPELPATAPVPAVPSALVEHARKVAAEHHARTGAPIDTPTLRARLGVPVSLADAIAAQLT